MANYNKQTKEEREAILKGNKTIKELSKQFNRHYMTIQQWAQNLQVKLPKTPNLSKKVTKTTLDFFLNWSPNMAYVLGFIAADGCIHLGPRNGGSIEISLSITDKEHLSKINKLMGTKCKIFIADTNYTTKSGKLLKRCRLHMCSKPLTDILISYGITPKKSLTLQFPTCIPDEYKTHFIRGYFDGDGCIRKRTHDFEISILGTQQFLFVIKSLFNKEYGIEIGSLRKSQSQYRLTYAGTYSPTCFGKWLYKGSNKNNRLNRKFKRFQKWKQENAKRRYQVPMGSNQ